MRLLSLLLLGVCSQLSDFWANGYSYPYASSSSVIFSTASQIAYRSFEELVWVNSVEAFYVFKYIAKVCIMSSLLQRNIFDQLVVCWVSAVSFEFFQIHLCPFDNKNSRLVTHSILQQWPNHKLIQCLLSKHHLINPMHWVAFVVGWFICEHVF